MSWEKFDNQLMPALTLDEFLANPALSSYRAWVEEPGFKSLYVRWGRHFIDGKMHAMLDLANANALHERSGALTRLLDRLEAQHPQLGLYMADVLNEHLHAFLVRRGFTRDPYKPMDYCYYRLGQP